MQKFYSKNRVLSSRSLKCVFTRNTYAKFQFILKAVCQKMNKISY